MAVLGGASNGPGIPVLEELFNRLADDFEIIFYCFSRVDKSKICPLIPVKQVAAWRLPGRLKFALLMLQFAWDHITNPYGCIFSVSVYPTGWWGIRLGKIFRIKTLVQVITMELVSMPKIPLGNLSKPWLRDKTTHVCRNADYIIAVAEYQMKLALTNVPQPMRIVSLPLRINPKKFRYRKREITFPVQFIHIAYYSVVKDQDTMFRAFAEVARYIPCHLTVIGEGYSIPKVKGMMTDLNIDEKVTFTGLLSQQEVANCFDKAHILLHPALYETGCAVIQEAMASGVGVCGTEVGLLSDIGDRYAMIVQPQAATELAQVMLTLVNDPQRYSQMTLDAYEWINSHDVEWATANYRIFIKNIIEEEA
jgi:glycosyltransferase involved in cell wall biosynthesis